MVHSGAYVARDEVIEAAQQGKIIISCAGEPNRYRSNPERVKLARNFWYNAELKDAGHGQAPHSFWCVARQIGQPNKDYRDLLVSRDEVLKEWPQHALAETDQSNVTRASIVNSTDPLSEEDAERALLDWAEAEKVVGRTVTQDGVTETVQWFLKRGIGRNEGRKWLEKIPLECRAKRGTKPAKPALPPHRH